MNKVDLIEPNLKPLIKSKLHQQMKDANIQIENIFFMDSIAASGRKGGYNDKVKTFCVIFLTDCFFLFSFSTH